MSPKETLYIEDALAHMQFMKEKCDCAQKTVTDATLKSLLTRIGEKNQTMFNDIYNVLSANAKGEA